MSGVLIKARDLVRRYPTAEGPVDGLRDVTFDVLGGEYIALMGASGSGKSTLINLLGLLDRPSGGVLRVAGAETRGLSPDQAARLRNRHIGFVFQSYHLLARHTALANVALPLAYRGASQRARRTGAEAALARSVCTAAGTPIRTSCRAVSSSGSQLRVRLPVDPQLLLADEPTGALDATSAAGMLGLLDSLHAEGRTVIVVTHDPAVAARAERLIILHSGRIAHDGPVPGRTAA